VVALEPEIALEAVEREIALAVESAPAIVREAGLEPEIVLVAAEREHDPVVAVLELAPAVAELARGHPHARPAAVAPTTKSVTAAHRRDLVRLLAAEDLAVAVAETTREPVATEAAIAWEVADTVAVEEAAVVEAAEDAVAAVVAVVEDEDKHSMRKNI
jgi:hypothetical protein